MNNTDMGETERSMGVAYSIVGAVALGGLGYVIDGWLGTRPLVAVLCLVAGAAIALFAIRILIENRSGM
jgi:F0F1-type ATP synthase assembly protein I